ncbi:MAG: glycosyltransferase, partial [Muribaculaceae bacterium]|nr:glycosyltransferase [Muribaculaceae bacterium]
LIYLIFIIVKTIFIGEPVQGFPTIMCTILFLGGCQLISIGIIGEYIGRIFKETKGRPPYLADTFRGKPVDNNKN